MKTRFPSMPDDKSPPSSQPPKPRVAEVIHVAFGPGGGRIDPRVLTPPPAPVVEEPETPAPPSIEPVLDVFSPKEVAKLLNVTTQRLRSLDRAEVVSPSGTRNGRRVYTFQDLIALRATHGLLRERVRLRDVKNAIAALRKSLPRVVRPLHELRITSDGQRVIVRADGAAFEPTTGQMVLDFQVGELEREVVKMLRPATADARTRTAYDLYLRASQLDEDPASFDEAEKLYHRAIELDPGLAIAYTNVGNIRYRKGDDRSAEEFYRRALEVDDRQPEAHYNLGYVMLERGQPARSIPYFLRALQADGRFSDAHFNLAMAYEGTGEPERARTHWRKYLELEPEGAWADVAREHLK